MTDATPRQGYFREEDFMLPVLRCFKGTVTASPDGKLLYVFGQLMTDITASSLLDRERTSTPEALIGRHLGAHVEASNDLGALEASIGSDPPIQEELWRFHYSAGPLLLGVYNLIQLVIFAWLVYAGHYREFVEDEDQLRILAAVVSVVRYFLWWLIAYAVFYIGWPLGRFLVMRWRNSSIRRRNAARALAVTRLSNASGI